MFGITEQQIKDGVARSEAAVEVLAQHGWAIPMDLTPREMCAITDAFKGDRFDEAFLAHYTDGEGENFSTIERQLVAAPHLAKWRPLVEECISAYRAGWFRIMIPSLFAVIEGAGASLGGKGGIQRVCSERMQAHGEGSFTRIIWKSVALFVDRAFEDGRAVPDTALNRNVVLHGRGDPASWRQVDALRLFQALHTLALIARK